MYERNVCQGTGLGAKDVTGMQPVRQGYVARKRKKKNSVLFRKILIIFVESYCWDTLCEKGKIIYGLRIKIFQTST